MLTVAELAEISDRAADGWLKWDVPNCVNVKQQVKDWDRLMAHLLELEHQKEELSWLVVGISRDLDRAREEIHRLKARE